MYLDFSLKKILLVAAVLIVMITTISMTLIQKRSYFGTTPYAYTILLGIRYASDTALYAFEENVPKLLALIGFSKPVQIPEESTSATSIPVLTYHRIVADQKDYNNVTVQKFKSQMQALKDAGWRTVPLSDFESFMRGEKDLPERSFLLTFDDGAKESYYPVDPILRALDFHAVMFVIARSAETAETDGSIYYLSPEEIRRMVKSRRWDIGSHSYDGHRPYPVDDISTSTGIFFADRLWDARNERLETPEEFAMRVRADLTNAKNDLEATYNTPIKSFAFPLGNETGINGANNYPEGAGVTEEIARSIYEFGFTQLSNQTFTYNFPGKGAASTTALSDPFLIRRVHVDYDWDGPRILSILENGLPKKIPYEDDFTVDRGWISAWGHIDVGRNNFTLSGASDASNASTFLDGTALWDNYTFDASVNWQNGDFFMLADVQNADTYDSCAFSPGQVKILSTRKGVVNVLTTVHDPRIQYGSGERMGIRVHGSNIECAWNFESVAQVQGRTDSGGIGFQMWDKTSGTSAQILSLIVRPHTSSQ